MWYAIVLTLLSGYFLGNLNGAVMMSALNGQEDVRRKGSGNAGFTNFLRNFGSKDAVCVLGIDVGKAILSCLLGRLLLEPYGAPLLGAMLGGTGAVLGHDFPLLLGFRGGKGIATSAFTLLVVDWRLFLVVVAVFLTVYFSTKYVSLASCLGAVALIIAVWPLHWEEPVIAGLATFLSVLALFMHRENIARLAKGTEQKTELHKKKG